MNKPVSVFANLALVCGLAVLSANTFGKDIPAQPIPETWAEKGVKLESVADNIERIDLGKVQIHTFYGVSNSHIIETRNELRLVDAQMTLSDAQALRDYIQTLDKPLKAVVLSHNHPDHWFGAKVFAKDTPIVTSAAISNDLKEGGMRYIKLMKKRLKDNMPDEVIVPDDVIEVGTHDWDGVNVVIEEYPEQEAHHSLVIKLPEAGVMIGQDLFYNQRFLVASERTRNQNWIKILENFQKTDANNYPVILVGHGKNTDPQVFQQNIDYLNTLASLLEKGLSKEETEKALLAQYPEYEGKGLLAISMRNLFSKGH